MLGATSWISETLSLGIGSDIVVAMPIRKLRSEYCRTTTISMCLPPPGRPKLRTQSVPWGQENTHST